jgi:hypothetical protein
MDRDLYYRSNRPTRRRSTKSVKKNLSYLKPFFFIIFIIFVFYLLISGVRGIINNSSGKLDNVATAFLVTGDAQVRPFGEGEFGPMISGQKLLEGDRLQTLDNSRVMLEFFGHTKVRLDEGSDVTIRTIDNNKTEENVEITVTAGQVWVNKGIADKPKSTMSVRSNYMDVKATGTIFAVKSGLPESVRVIDGEVFVDVIEVGEEKPEVLDSFSVGIGQEAVMNNVAYEQFQRRETASVLGPVDTDFKITQWYKWNISEDQNPTVYEVDASLKNDRPETEIVSENPVVLTEDEVSFDDLDSVSMDAPEVSSPRQGMVITEESVEIGGRAPEGAQQIVVTSYEDGVANPYILKGFEPGDPTWLYIAAYQNGQGNMTLGENRYEIMAIDEDGKESKKAVLVFYYNPE